MKHNHGASPIARWQRKILLGATFTLICIGLLENSMAGGKFSDQGNALYKSLHDELIAKSVCTNFQNCSDALQMYGEDGDRIYLNMYAQTDMNLSGIVVKFIVEKGIKITGGMPITLRVFHKPKTQYLGLKSIFGKDESIKLEINK